MKPRELYAVLLVAFGFGLFAAGWWLCWDYLLSLGWIFDWGRLKTDWYFDLPFRIYTYRYPNWTVPFDLALAVAALGAIFICIGSFLVGWLKE